MAKEKTQIAKVKGDQTPAPQATAPAQIAANEIVITSDLPFIASGKPVARIVVDPIGFEGFTEATRRANETRGSELYRKVLYRERRKIQCKAFDAAGGEVKVTEQDWFMLPVAYASKLFRLIETDPLGARPGEIVSDGNVATQSIVYRLGTPLRTSTDATIEELEFSAQTLGDIEDVLAEASPFAQTLALIRNRAKPIGGDVTLVALPSWAVSAVTLIDGMTIMDKVLPRFLE